MTRRMGLAFVFFTWYPLPLQRASEPRQAGFIGTFFGDLVSRHLRYVHYEGILHN